MLKAHHTLGPGEHIGRLPRTGRRVSVAEHHKMLYTNLQFTCPISRFPFLCPISQFNSLFGSYSQFLVLSTHCSNSPASVFMIAICTFQLKPHGFHKPMSFLHGSDVLFSYCFSHPRYIHRVHPPLYRN